MKRKGFTLIEVIVAMAAGFIVMMTIAMLVQSGYRSWNQTYRTANSDSRLDSIAATTSFGSIGRKSNKNDYYVYVHHAADTTFTAPPLNLLDPDEILTGQAVEFRYWSTDLDDAMLTPTSVADRYALFYLDYSQPGNVQLKLDTGTSTGGPTGGAINAAGHRVVSTSTTTLARHVTSVTFTHTKKTPTGGGLGCVRMRLEINDPADNKSKTVIAATYIRNVWPQ
jgi:prepilin-type N-terminal cleavage/methylation domain-containing protein